MARVGQGTDYKASSFLPGIYYGKVISNIDVDKTGKIKVRIDYIHKDPKFPRVIQAKWLHAFAGATDPAKTNADVSNYDKAMKTYGMWVQPPDKGNMVLVCFANGNSQEAFCLGSILPDQFNNMLPGMPGGKSYQAESFNVPVVEKNKFSDDPSNDIDAQRPIHHPFAEAITVQGLINDPVRGVGKSGARRESPSDVFGILTKGVRNPDDINDVQQAGHQFVMDDNPNSKNIRIRTGSGNQILLDDTNGIIYMINKGGKAWMELDMFGNINVFGEGSLNMRAKGDFNLRADKNIHIEAGQDIQMKASGDNIGGEYVGLPGALSAIGLPPLGAGGNIRFDAAADMSLFANLNAALTANGGDIDVSSGGRTAITASGPLGVHVNAPLGPIAMSSTLVTSIMAMGGFGVTSTGPAMIMAPMIGLNSGGAPAIPALPAVPAARISASPQKDQSSTPPKYDAESDVVLPTGGKRENNDTIETSVSVLVTAEPYDGHAQFDQESEDPSSMTEDTSADGETGKDEIEAGEGAVADTPEGTKVKEQEKKSVTGAVNDAASAVNGAVDQATGAINQAVSEAKDLVNGKLDGYKDLLPDELSNFNFAALKNINSLDSIMSLANDFGIAIPPIRFQTSNAMSEKIIGITKKLQEAESRLNEFALDINNLPLDIQGEAVGKVKGMISDTIKETTDKVSGTISEGTSAVSGAVDTVKDATGGGT